MEYLISGVLVNEQRSRWSVYAYYIINNLLYNHTCLRCNTYILFIVRVLIDANYVNR